MSSQRFKNELKDSQNDPDFDLDSYLDEQYQGAQKKELKEDEKTNKASAFFKNTFLVLSFAILTLLYFNDWNPRLVYGNIFGIEKFQDTQAPTPSPIKTSAPIVSNNNDRVIVVDSDNLAGTTTNLPGLAGLENLSKLSTLGLLGNFDNATVIQSDNNDEFPSSLENYSNELNEIGLSTKFDTDITTQLYNAKVPTSILKTLNDNNLLDTIDISSLIEGYNNSSN